MTPTFDLINQESVLKPSVYKKLQKKHQSVVPAQHFIPSSPRLVFIDLNCFHSLWRNISSSVLLNSILILPDVDYKYIAEPYKHLNDYNHILRDLPFRKLLEWKYEQQLLFCNHNNKKDTNTDSFWLNLSKKLVELENPADYMSSTYFPLKLDEKYYKSLTYKYSTSYSKIKKGLTSVLNVSNDTVKEILYQSNPSLVVIEGVSDYVQFNKQILDELNVNNNNLLYAFSIQYSSDYSGGDDDNDNDNDDIEPVIPVMDDIMDNFAIEWNDMDIDIELSDNDNDDDMNAQYTILSNTSSFSTQDT